KFLNYLDLYRRYMLGKDNYPGETAAVPVDEDLPESVRNAIAAQQAQSAEPEKPPALRPGEQNPAATVQPARTAPAIPAAEPSAPVQMPVRPAMPERSTAFPDPARPIAASSQPSPQPPAAPASQPAETPAAPEKKPEVDVDALFDQVLAEHGRSRHPAPRKKGLFRR
ncbi:MAG: hypothetical protein IKN55_10570, partial [Oscillospiraceae bacterium]|nr:hypothetical protein [Oscillospiraceae bacterium]